MYLDKMAKPWASHSLRHESRIYFHPLILGCTLVKIQGGHSMTSRDVFEIHDLVLLYLHVPLELRFCSARRVRPELLQ